MDTRRTGVLQMKQSTLKTVEEVCGALLGILVVILLTLAGVAVFGRNPPHHIVDYVLKVFFIMVVVYVIFASTMLAQINAIGSDHK